MSWTNYHNHCHYCDGKGTVEEHIKSAISSKILSLGFSCHAPVPFANNWSMSKDRIQDYLDEIEEGKQKYEDKIYVYKSLEVDYIPGMISPSDEEINALNLDYTIGSVHFVGEFANGRLWEIDGRFEVFKKGLNDIYKNDVKYVVQRFYELTREMVRESCPDIIGHLDKIKMHNRDRLLDEQSDWYRDEIMHTLEEIQGTSAIVEVNTRGIYKKLTTETYPSPWILRHMEQMGIPIHINADSHHPRELVKEFATTYELVHSLGFRQMKVMLNGSWDFVDINQYGIIATETDFIR